MVGSTQRPDLVRIGVDLPFSPRPWLEGGIPNQSQDLEVRPIVDRNQEESVLSVEQRARDQVQLLRRRQVVRQ